MKKITEINIPTYAKKMGVTKAAVAYRLSNKIPMPGIISHQQIMGWWILSFDNSTNIEQAKKEFRTKNRKSGSSRVA